MKVVCFLPIQILNSIHRSPGFRIPALTTDGLVVLGATLGGSGCRSVTRMISTEEIAVLWQTLASTGLQELGEDLNPVQKGPTDEPRLLSGRKRCEGSRVMVPSHPSPHRRSTMWLVWGVECGQHCRSLAGTLGRAKGERHVRACVR